jgi:hypothetical protein
LAESRRARFRESDGANFPGSHEIGHRADRVFDRRRGIDAVLIVQVDGVDAEPLQRGVAALPHVLRPSTDAEERAIGGAHVAEFGGNDDLIAA